MRRTPSAGLAFGFAIAMLVAAAPAHAVRVSTGTGSGLAGQTVDIDVNTTSVTGLGVQSLQFSLNYNNNVVTAVDVITPGSLTAAASWAAPQFHVSNVNSTGTISVSDAGNTALTGAGSLLKVRFTINPTLLNGSSTPLSLPTFTYNEGTPIDTTSGSTLTVGATPQIDISPDAGEIVRGATLQFYVSGSPTPPITWTTSSFSIADISSSGLLTGTSPGTVTVTATDAASHSAATTGVIAVRGMSLTAGTASVVVGQPLTLPVTVSSLDGLAIRSGQFMLLFNGNLVTATGVTTPPGTLLHGWGSTSFDQGPGSATVAFAGPTDLAGSGVLCYVTFATNQPGYAGGSFSSATFNENLPALRVSGNITVNALPTITVNPDQVTLLAGQTQPFTLSGSYTAPISWSVEDPTVASITPGGLLTALAGGVTRVRAQDAVGAVDYSTSLTVYDFKATLGSATGLPGTTVKLSLVSDRLVGGLAIHSLQFHVTWPTAYITGARSSPSGLWNAWSPGGIVDRYAPNLLAIAAGGATTMGNTGPELASILLDVSPSTPIGVDIPLTISALTCNEGSPSPQLVGGTIHVRSTADIAPEAGGMFALGASEPNPAAGRARIPFSLPTGAPAPVRLAIYSLDGRRVRWLVRETLGSGPHETTWDGLDDAGQPARAGVYFTRLEWRGRIATRKLARVE
jgi:hypothetical protein